MIRSRKFKIVGGIFLSLLLVSIISINLFNSNMSYKMSRSDNYELIGNDLYSSARSTYGKVGTSYDQDVSFSTEMSDFSQDLVNVTFKNEEVSQNPVKVIKNGSISLSVDEVEASYNRIIELTKNLGGYEFNKNYTSRDTSNMQIVIKLPPDKIEVFEDELKKALENVRITNVQISSQDISSQYYDTSARLNSYLASRDKFLEIYEKAQTVEDILKVQNEITKLQANIDSLQGQINMWDQLISMSTLTINISQTTNPMKNVQEVEWNFNSFSDVITLMKTGLMIVINNLYSFILWALIIIVSSLPITIPLGIIIWVLVKKNRKIKSTKP